MLFQPLCVILLQMNGYIHYFDDGGKNMSFVTEDEEVYKKYNEIWEAVRKLLKLKFTVCSYHVAYAFQSESTLYSCLNVKELLARSRREI